MNAKYNDTMRRQSTLFVGALLGLLVAASSAGAKDVLFLAGAEGGTGGTASYYNFVGAIAPLVGKSFGTGLMQKYKVDFQGYSYPVANTNVDATAVGVEGAVGYQYGGKKGWAGVYGGFRYSNTWLSPDDPNSRVRGSLIRPAAEVGGERVLSEEWKINGLGSYVFISDSYWSRGRVAYRASGPVYTGPEVTFQGDPTYRAYGAGWFVTGFEPVPKSSLGFKAGVRKIEKTDPAAYVGIEFSRMF